MDDVGHVGERIARGGSWLARLVGSDDVRRDMVLPAALLIVQLAGAAATVSGPHGSDGHLPPGGWLLMVVGPAALVFRRRWPVGVLWLSFLATVSPWNAAWPANLSLVVAFFVAATGRHRRAAWLVVVVGYVSSVWLDALAFGNKAASVAFALGLAGWLGALVIAAEVVRLRRERTASAKTARALDARRRASEERLAMARDLHDAIGHNVSLINVQAAVALDLMDEDTSGQARAALSVIESASREVLDELRAMLSALRSGADGAPRAPAPTLDRLDQLIELTRAAGMTVHLEVMGERRQLPVAVQVAGYRVIQESLTNALRHAGPATTSIRLAYTADGLDIEVSDDGLPGKAAGSSGPGTGSGIEGMRERVVTLGGFFRAGPQPAGGFAVSAHIPSGGEP